MKKNIIRNAKEKKSIYPVGVTVSKGKIGLFFKSAQLSKIGLYLTKGNTGLSFNPSRNKIPVTFPKRQKGMIEESVHISISPCDKGYFMAFIQKGKKRTNR